MKPTVIGLVVLVSLLALAVPGVAHAQVFSDDAQLGLEPTTTKCDELSSKAGAVELNVRCGYAEGGAIGGFLSRRDKACVDRELEALKGALSDEKHRELLQKLKLSRIVLELSDNSHAKVDDAKLEYGSFLGTALVRESQSRGGEYAFASYDKSLRGDEATRVGFEWKSFTDTSTRVVGKRDVALGDKLVRQGDGFTSCWERCDKPRTQEVVNCYNARYERSDDRCNSVAATYDSQSWWVDKRNAPSVADWVRLYPYCGECYQGKTDTATAVTGRGRQRLETVMAIRFAIGADGKCGSTLVSSKDFVDSFEAWKKEAERLEALDKVDLGAKAASTISMFGDSTPVAKQADGTDSKTAARVLAGQDPKRSGPAGRGQSKAN